MADSRFTTGEKAPGFTLLNQDDSEVSLSDFAGRWVVLYFYPRDNTSGCTQEACEFTDSIKDFEELDAVVLGCSPDSTASHRKFIAKFDLKVTLLSDPEHQAMAAYGAWGEKTMYGKKKMGVIRSTALIDPAGHVAFHWRSVKAAGHAEKVRAKLAELR